MEAAQNPLSVPKKRLWPGIAITALPVLFLAFDCTIKLMNLAPVAEAMQRVGWPPDMGPALGALELACLALYLVPRTAPLGAVLMTGLLGGAIATHLRVQDPLFSHALFPLYIGALLWVGLFLREKRLALVLAIFAEKKGESR